MPCKGNCAAYVKRNTPHVKPIQELYVNYCATVSTRRGIILLDMHSCCGIIAITIGMPILGDRGAREKRQQASEGPCPPRRGHAEPSTREGPRSEIPRQRVLRPPRHRAGQVRDAAPRFGRECVGCQRNGRIRRVEADVLSDQGQFRRSGGRWACTEEAGAAPPPPTPTGRTGGFLKTPPPLQTPSQPP